MRTLAHRTRWLLLALVLGVAPRTLADREVFRDDFSNPRRGWPVTDPSRPAQGGLFTYLTDGSYQLTPLTDEGYLLATPPVRGYSADVAVEADAFLASNTADSLVGVACRVQGANDFYGFVVGFGGRGSIVKVRGGRWQALQRGRYTSRGIGAQRVRAECAGDRLRLVVNGTPVAEALDGALSHGQAAVLVGAERGAGASGAFDRFVLHELSGAARAQAPAPRDAGSPPSRTTLVRHPVRALRPNQALVVVEYRGFRHESVVALADGLRVISGRVVTPLGAHDVLISPGESSYGVVLKSGPGYDSGIGSWDIEVDRASGRGACRRSPLDTHRRGRLTVLNAAGEEVCSR